MTVIVPFRNPNAILPVNSDTAHCVTSSVQRRQPSHADTQPPPQLTIRIPRRHDPDDPLLEPARRHLRVTWQRPTLPTLERRLRRTRRRRERDDAAFAHRVRIERRPRTA